MALLKSKMNNDMERESEMSFQSVETVSSEEEVEELKDAESTRKRICERRN